MYLVYIYNKIHQLINKTKKSIVSYNKDRMKH